MSDIEVGCLNVPASASRAAELAVLAENAGIGWFGVGDSPKIFGPLYPSIQWALSKTNQIKVGPLVTNPVTRHWSVHASTFRAFEELFPGRSFLGIAAGDSAVHSVGLKPGRPADVSAVVEACREAVDGELPIIVAVGGPKAAAAVSPVADGVLIGTGFEPTAFEELSALADAAPGGSRKRWVYAVCHLVDREDQIESAQADVRAAVIAFSRQALSGRMETKHVPPSLVPGLRAMYSQYVFGEHARLGSANADLLAAHPREEAYLVERFTLIDTPEGAAKRVGEFRAAVGEFGLFVGTMVPNPEEHIGHIGRMIDILRAEGQKS